ncbi:sulfotransferase, partial [bacterium]|nr:sulfotransferase [bacterium]
MSTIATPETIMSETAKQSKRGQKRSEFHVQSLANMEHSQNRRHLLITGAPRSGTTLLTTMIGRHDEVGLLVEDRRFTFVQIASKTVVGNKLCVPGQITFEEEWKAGGSSYSKYPIEKYLQLPNFKMIMIIRHGNRIISSIVKRADKPVDVAVQQWKRSVEIMAALKQRLSEDALVVSYERLLSDAENQMRRVSEFLQIDFQPKMLEGYKYNFVYP